MRDRRLILFAKPPLPGRVKTRLAKDLGAARAAGEYRRMLRGLMQRLGKDARWNIEVSQAGPGRLAQPGCPVARQAGGNLGRRLQAALAAHPGDDVLIIGTDIPDIQAADIAAGFDALRRHDLVFGPAADGGFWLIGARAGRGRHLRLHGVRWSSPHTLRDTVALARPSHAIAWLRPLRDIDTVDDLLAWRRGAALPRKVIELPAHDRHTPRPQPAALASRPSGAA